MFEQYILHSIAKQQQLNSEGKSFMTFSLPLLHVFVFKRIDNRTFSSREFAKESLQAVGLFYRVMPTITVCCLTGKSPWRMGTLGSRTEYPRLK